jgi:hypothetical protein
MSHRIIEEPVDHSLKRYFLESKKRANVLEVKFKMHFHMLYEKDLLIVLDIKHELLKDLQIRDNNNFVLYSHIKQKTVDASTTSIYPEDKRRNFLNTILEDQIKERISDLNTCMSLTRLAEENTEDV